MKPGNRLAPRGQAAVPIPAEGTPLRDESFGHEASSFREEVFFVSLPQADGTRWAASCVLRRCTGGHPVQ